MDDPKCLWKKPSEHLNELLVTLTLLQLGMSSSKLLHPPDVHVCVTTGIGLIINLKIPTLHLWVTHYEIGQRPNNLIHCIQVNFTWQVPLAERSDTRFRREIPTLVGQPTIDRHVEHMSQPEVCIGRVARHQVGRLTADDRFDSFHALGRIQQVLADAPTVGRSNFRPHQSKPVLGVGHLTYF